MSEVTTRTQIFTTWKPGPMVDAILAAMKAGAMQEASIALEARWDDRKLAETRIDEEIRAAVVRAEQPNMMYIFAAIAERGHVGVTASDGLVSVSVEGADTQMVNRAFDAAAAVMRQHTEPYIPVGQRTGRPVLPPTPVAPAVASEPTAPRHPIRVWCEENQGVLAASGLAVAVIGIILGVALS
jgi:hypothetical protein